MPGNKHINYTSADIDKYLKGELTARERHELEKASLDDPFLAEALEGFSTTRVDIQADLGELAERLNKQENRGKVVPMIAAPRKGFPWLRAAAMVLLLATAGWLIAEFAIKDKTPGIAQTEDTNPAVTATDSVTENTTRASNSTAASDSLSSPSKEEAGNLSTTNPAIVIVPTDDRQLPQKTFATIEPSTTAPRTDQTVTNPQPENHKEEPSVQAETRDKLASQKLESDKQRIDSISKQNQGIAEKKKTEEQDDLSQYRDVHVFRGQVTDSHNNALPFANITNTKDNVGTYSDAKGYFTLVSTDSVLDVSVRSLGYENTRTVLSEEETTNRILLEEDRSITARVLDTVKRNLVRARAGNLRFEEPEPADGWDYYDTYLVNNLNVPDTYERKRSELSGGEVELSFEVNRQGEPINIKVEKSLCDQCDQEAIRLVKEGPKWKRKARKGRTRVMVPFY